MTGIRAASFSPFVRHSPALILQMSLCYAREYGTLRRSGPGRLADLHMFTTQNKHALYVNHWSYHSLEQALALNSKCLAGCSVL